MILIHIFGFIISLLLIIADINKNNMNGLTVSMIIFLMIYGVSIILFIALFIVMYYYYNKPRIDITDLTELSKHYWPKDRPVY